jgi:hypothetical protein
MFWVGVIVGACIGGVGAFLVGVWVRRSLIEDERAKALEMATALIEARERADELPAVHPSISLGCQQQFLYEVIFGGDDGTET